RVFRLPTGSLLRGAGSLILSCACAAVTLPAHAAAFSCSGVLSPNPNILGDTIINSTANCLNAENFSNFGELTNLNRLTNTGTLSNNAGGTLTNAAGTLDNTSGTLINS